MAQINNHHQILQQKIEVIMKIDNLLLKINNYQRILQQKLRVIAENHRSVAAKSTNINKSCNKN